VGQSKDLILMQKCSSCLIISASYIIGTGSKNGVLGGDKHKFITIIWGRGLPLRTFVVTQDNVAFSNCTVYHAQKNTTVLFVRNEPIFRSSPER